MKLLEVERNLTITVSGAQSGMQGVSFQVESGELLGIAGLPAQGKHGDAGIDEGFCRNRYLVALKN